MNCPKCGGETFDNSMNCIACGETIQQQAQTDENTEAVTVATPQSAYSQPYSLPASQVPYVAPPMFIQPQKPGDKSKNWLAICSMICGIASIPMMVTAFGGVFTALTAIIFSFKGFGSQKVGMAVAGISCGIIGLLLSGFMVYSMIIGQLLYPELYS